MKRGGYVYILTNKNNTVLYTGVTSNLNNRVNEHREGKFASSFTNKYKCHKLVFYEGFARIEDAIAREKQIKGGSRAKKIALINGINPQWNDLLSEVDE